MPPPKGKNFGVPAPRKTRHLRLSEAWACGALPRTHLQCQVQETFCLHVWRTHRRCEC